jgi:hypothetical protein
MYCHGFYASQQVGPLPCCRRFHRLSEPLALEHSLAEIRARFREFYPIAIVHAALRPRWASRIRCRKIRTTQELGYQLLGPLLLSVCVSASDQFRLAEGRPFCSLALCRWIAIHDAPPLWLRPLP